MTATERVFQRDSENMVSMNDTEIYGNIIDQLCFKSILSKKIQS